jgi:hypothetical protein
MAKSIVTIFQGDGSPDCSGGDAVISLWLDPDDPKENGDRIAHGMLQCVVCQESLGPYDNDYILKYFLVSASRDSGDGSDIFSNCHTPQIFYRSSRPGSGRECVLLPTPHRALALPRVGFGPRYDYPPQCAPVGEGRGCH